MKPVRHKILSLFCYFLTLAFLFLGISPTGYTNQDSGPDCPPSTSSSSGSSGSSGAQTSEGGNLDHAANRDFGQGGLKGVQWANDIQWAGKKKDNKEDEEKKRKRKEEEEEKKRKKKEEDERKKREREEKRQREREERERKEREKRERRERERREREEADEPDRPPIRPLTYDESLIAGRLKSMNVGFPQDWMKMSPQLRNELGRQMMQQNMAGHAGLPDAVKEANRARLEKLLEQERARNGFVPSGGLRAWMDGTPYSGDEDAAQANANRAQPQPPDQFGPWPGETEEEWIDRLAENIAESTAQNLIWQKRQQHAAMMQMGYGNCGMVNQAGCDKAFADGLLQEAKWAAQEAMKAAHDPKWREWLKNASEEELRKLNIHRDGTMRVQMGVAHRGEGMGPQLNFDKADAAEAKDREMRRLASERELQHARENLAAMNARSEARAREQAARDQALRDARIARAQADQNAQPQQPAAQRQPATASWTDDQGNAHVWTSSGNTRSITTIGADGKASTQTMTSGTGAGSASLTDSSGNQHSYQTDGLGNMTHTVTDSSGKTQSVPVQNYSSQTSANWTDDFGNRHTLTSNGQGSRTETTVSPAGQTSSTTTLTGTGRATASWTDASGSTQIINSNSQGIRTQTTITSTGQSSTRNLAPEPTTPSATYKDSHGNNITLTGNPDGSKTTTTTRTDGTTTITTEPKTQGSFASWTDSTENQRTLSSNGDGTRNLTTSPAGGGEPVTQKLGADDKTTFISGATPDGGTVRITEVPGGKREITTTDAGGNSTTVIRGGEPSSASATNPDGTIVRVTNLGNGTREIVTSKPDGNVHREIRGAEPTMAAVTSPDGTTVSVTSRGDGTREVTTLKPDGTSSTEVRGKEPSFVTTQQPDGTQVTVMDRGGGEHTVTVTKPDGTSQTYTRGHEPNSATAVSPDGTIVTVTKRADGTHSVSTTTPDGKTSTEARGKEADSVTLTQPDGTKITASRNPNGQTQVTTTKPDGSTTTMARSAEPVGGIVTQPDGTKITVTRRSDGTREITTTTRDGQTTTETRGKEADTATITRADGSTVTATRQPDGKMEITARNSSGKTTSTEVHGKEPRSGTATQPDGTTITVTKRNDGTREIVTTRPDGTQTTEIRGKEKDSASITQPDGTTITARRGADGKIEVVATTLNGETKPVASNQAPAPQAGQAAAGNQPAQGQAAQPAGGLTAEWKDDQGNRHTMAQDIQGNKTETIYYPDGRVTTKQNGPNGTSEITTRPDGTREVIDVNPVTGERTIQQQEAKDLGGRAGVNYERRDAEGNLLEQGRVDKYGNFQGTAFRPDGAQTIVLTDRDGNTTVLEVNKDGWGAEVVYDAEGRVVSSREGVLVTKMNGENGYTTINISGLEGNATERTYDREGNASSYDSDAENKIDRGRKIYEDQRRELGLSTRWEDLKPDVKAEYQHEQTLREESAARRAEDVREREQRLIRAENLQRQDEETIRKYEKESATIVAQIEARAQHEENRRAADQARRDAEVRAERADAEYRAEVDRIMGERRAQLEERFRAEVKDPSDPRQIAQFHINEIMRAVDQRMQSDNQILSSGRTRELNEQGEVIERAATREELEAISIRNRLANNLRNIMNVNGPGSNFFAREEVAKNYLDLINRQDYAEAPREIMMGRSLNGGKGYDISDLRAAREADTNTSVEAYQQRAFDEASKATRQRVDDGLLRGAAAMAFAMNDIFTELNPADPLLRIGLGIHTSGAKIGQDMTAGDYAQMALHAGIGFLVHGAIGSVAESAAGYGKGVSLTAGGRGVNIPESTSRNSSSGMRQASRAGGEAESIAEGGASRSSTGRPGANSSEEFSGGGSRPTVRPSAEIPEGMPRAPRPAIDAEGIGPTGTQAGQLRKPLGQPLAQTPGALPLKETPYPRGIGDPNLTNVHHAGMDVELRPGATPPRGLSGAQLQEWHDLRAQHQAVMNSRAGGYPDIGDDALIPSGVAPERGPGGYSSHLSPTQVDELFQPGRNLTPDQVIAKADLIRTGRAPIIPIDPATHAALDATMRKAFPEINLGPGRSFGNSDSGGVSNATIINGPRPAVSPSSSGGTQNFNQVLKPQTQVLENIPNPRTPAGTAPTPGTQRFNMEIPEETTPSSAGARTSGGSTQVLEKIPGAVESPRTLIIHNDGSAITGASRGTPIRTPEAPTVGGPREGTTIQPPAAGGTPLKLQPTIPRNAITDEMVYSRNPPQPMDPDFVKKYPDFGEVEAIATQRKDNWSANPHLEATLDARARELLRTGAEGGSAGARKILEQEPTIAYQPDMKGNIGGAFDPSTNTMRINPYRNNPGQPLQMRTPIEVAGIQVHEAGHGRGTVGQAEIRGGGSGAPTLPDALGQGQGRGYNEFRAFYEEGAFYERIRQQNPTALDGLPAGQRRFADGFSEALKNGPEASRQFIVDEIGRRGYERHYPTPDEYAQAVSPHRGGSVGRIGDARMTGTTPENLVPGGTDRLQERFPTFRGTAPLPTSPAPLPPPPAPLPGTPSSKKPTIQYPIGSEKNN